MDTERTKEVRAEVAKIVASGSPLRGSGYSTSDVVDMLMSVIEDVAGDEYERGRGDGAFNESFYNSGL